MKDAFYFSHDYGARNDPKLVKLQMNEGHKGKGLYWDLIEMMYEQGGFLYISEIKVYAFELRTECECITNLIRDYDLFKNDGEKFWSESVLNRLKIREEKSIKARKSADSRWKNANAMRTHSEGNAIKERKGKEIKVNSINNSFSFYKIEVDKAKKFSDPMSKDYVSFCNHVCLKNKDGSWRLPEVLKMSNQVTLHEFSKLYTKSGNNLDTILAKVDTLQTNVKYHGRYTDVYLTINRWISNGHETFKRKD